MYTETGALTVCLYLKGRVGQCQFGCRRSAAGLGRGEGREGQWRGVGWRWGGRGQWRGGGGRRRHGGADGRAEQDKEGAGGGAGAAGGGAGGAGGEDPRGEHSDGQPAAGQGGRRGRGRGRVRLSGEAALGWRRGVQELRQDGRGQEEGVH